MLDVFTFKITIPELQILPFLFATRNKKSKCRSHFPFASTTPTGLLGIL